jgi:hypothetical protein
LGQGRRQGSCQLAVQAHIQHQYVGRENCTEKRITGSLLS